MTVLFLRLLRWSVVATTLLAQLAVGLALAALVISAGASTAKAYRLLGGLRWNASVVTFHVTPLGYREWQQNALEALEDWNRADIGIRLQADPSSANKISWTSECRPNAIAWANFDEVLSTEMKKVSIWLSTCHSWSPWPYTGRIYIRHVLVHEIGHAIGLAHSSEDPNESNLLLRTAVMYPWRPADQPILPNADDIAGARALYGARPRPTPTPPPVLVYQYEWIAQSPGVACAPGEQRQLWLRLQNTGSAPWPRDGSNPVRLGTSRPPDRSSAFYTPGGGWVAPNRVVLDQSSVAPGQVGGFSFTIRCPDRLGVYDEYFQPLVEGLTWMHDSGIYWRLVVNARPAPPPPPTPTPAPAWQMFIFTTPPSARVGETVVVTFALPRALITNLRLMTAVTCGHMGHYAADYKDDWVYSYWAWYTAGFGPCSPGTHTISGTAEPRPWVEAPTLRASMSYTLLP